MEVRHDRVPLVFVDTSVLYPVTIVNLLFTSAEEGFIDICVSDHLVAEVARVLVEYKGLEPDKVNVFCAQMNELASQHICAARYKSTKDQLTGPDDDDLWHLAAAIEAGADYLVTSNPTDFTDATIPDRFAAPKIVTADELMTGFIGDGLADDLARVVVSMTERLKRPPLTRSYVAVRL